MYKQKPNKQWKALNKFSEKNLKLKISLVWQVFSTVIVFIQNTYHFQSVIAKDELFISDTYL